MSFQELIASLRKESEERVQQIWSEAEERAEEAKKETLKRIEELRESHRSALPAEVKNKTETIIVDAENKATMIQLVTEESLSERLLSLALSLTSELRKEGYREVFQLLVKELPRAKWQLVRVNPDDVGIAAECFHDTEIVAEGTIQGGMDVETEDGALRVMNTFEKRLEKAWDEMLPLLMKDIYKKIA